jgi:hypothetical protein
MVQKTPYSNFRPSNLGKQMTCHILSFKKKIDQQQVIFPFIKIELGAWAYPSKPYISNIHSCNLDDFFYICSN